MKCRLSRFVAVALVVTFVTVPACTDEDGSGNDGGVSGGPSNGQHDPDASVGTGGMGGESQTAGTAGMSLDGGGAGLGGGGADDGNDGAVGTVRIAPTFETLKFVMNGYRPDINCAASDCHSGGHAHSSVPLRLVADEQLYEELLNHSSAKCGNIPAVDPGNPETSALLMMLKGPCGDPADPEHHIPRMPFGCFEDEWENNCVSDDYIAAIERWIARGAPEHEE